MRLKSDICAYCWLMILLIGQIRCELSLFPSSSSSNLNKQQNKDDFLNSNSLDDEEKFDRLYLFPELKDPENEMSTQLNKETLCRDYCTKLNENDHQKQIELLNQNLIGSLRYYKSFVHMFLVLIKNHNLDLEKSSYKLEVELSKHEVDVLDRFAESEDESTPIDLLQDVTDILKNMFLVVEPIKVLDFIEKCAFYADFIFTRIVESAVLKWTAVFLSTSILIVLFMKASRKLPVFKCCKYFTVLVLFICFVLSAYNNHQYLDQKKKIFNQQKLKEFVPQECLSKETELNNNKGGLNSVLRFFKHQLGFTPTSRSCLEYHEAMFIASSHNNYIETIMFTISEAIKPLSLVFGQFINQFYFELTKDAGFFHKLLLLPIGFIFAAFVFMLIFGYDLNFFYLFSFKKRRSSHHIAAPSAPMLTSGVKRDELAKILDSIKKETSNLPLPAKASECLTLSTRQENTNINNAALLPLEGENIDEAFNTNVKTLFAEVRAKVEEIKSENDELKKKLKKAQSEKLNDALNHKSTESKSVDKIVTIGLNSINKSKDESYSTSESDVENSYLRKRHPADIDPNHDD